MKNLLLILNLVLFSCKEQKEVYETEIKTYVISHKNSFLGRNGGIYKLYFQTPTSTEETQVTQDTYDKYKIKDTIQVLIKYWEKPKKK